MCQASYIITLEIWALTKVFHRRVHLCHSDTVGDCTLSSDNATESVQILLSQLFEQDQAQLAQQLIFATLLDHNGETCREIHRLLVHFCALVVSPPQNGQDNLCEVGLDTDAQGVDNRAKSVEQDLIFHGLFLE